jgi:hypothetical protein
MRAVKNRAGAIAHLLQPGEQVLDAAPAIFDSRMATTGFGGGTLVVTTKSLHYYDQAGTYSIPIDGIELIGEGQSMFPGAVRIGVVVDGYEGTFNCGRIFGANLLGYLSAAIQARS